MWGPLRRWVGRLASLVGAALVLCPAWAQAGVFHVSPVLLTLSQAHPTASLNLRNEGDQGAVVQLEVVAWSQADGKDIYTPSRDLLVNPPIFTLPRGDTQVVRVGLRRPVDSQRELAYRIYLQEVPPPPKPGFQGLQIATRVGVPIFVSPAAPAAPLLRWQVARARSGVIELSLTNTGEAHIQVLDFTLSLPGSTRVVAMQQAAAYLLAGQARRWVVHPEQDWQGERLSLSAHTDQGEVTAEIDLAKP